MQKTFSQLQEVDGVIGVLYAQNPEARKSKFGHTYDQFHKKNYQPILKEFQDAIAYIRLANALEDEKTKEVLIDSTATRGYKYSKEGLRKCMEQEVNCIEEFNAKTVECEAFIVSPESVPEGLTDSQKEVLAGLLI